LPDDIIDLLDSVCSKEGLISDDVSVLFDGLVGDLDPGASVGSEGREGVEGDCGGWQGRGSGVGDGHSVRRMGGRAGMHQHVRPCEGGRQHCC